MFLNCYKAFTLAELLIALAILGVIATFTIPKVLQSQQDGKYNALAKEAVAAVSGAYMNYKLQNTPNASTHLSNFTQYLNYVSVQTSGAIDARYSVSGTKTCSATVPCLKLHNGAILSYYAGNGGATSGNYFGGTTNHFLYFMVDPDGVVTSSSTTNGPGKTVDFVLYFNGATRLYADCTAGDLTYEDNAAINDCGTPPPVAPWFSWN